MSEFKGMNLFRFTFIPLLLLALGNGSSIVQASGWKPSAPQPAGVCEGFDQICIEWDFDEFSSITECCIGDFYDELEGCTSPASIRDDNYMILGGTSAIGGNNTVHDYSANGVLPQRSTKSSDESRHTVPRIPLTIDHIPYPAEAVTQFDGQPLHFLMCRTSIAQSTIFGFTTASALYNQLHACAARKPSFIVPEAPEGVSGVAFYEGTWWTGASYFLPIGQSVELTGTWWNQRISSLRSRGPGTFLTLFENADRSGSSLTLTNDLGWQDLEALGWDNRAAALVVWPAPTKPAKPTVLPRQ